MRAVGPRSRQLPPPAALRGLSTRVASKRAVGPHSRQLPQRVALDGRSSMSGLHARGWSSLSAAPSACGSRRSAGSDHGHEAHASGGPHMSLRGRSSGSHHHGAAPLGEGCERPAITCHHQRPLPCGSPPRATVRGCERAAPRHGEGCESPPIMSRSKVVQVVVLIPVTQA